MVKKESSSSQLIFRGIFLLFIFGWDIIQFISSAAPELWAEWWESTLGWLIFLVFFGPLLLVFVFSKFRKLFKAWTEMIENVTELWAQQWPYWPQVWAKKNMTITGEGQSQISTHSSYVGKIWTSQTVTGEKVNPFSLNGD